MERMLIADDNRQIVSILEEYAKKEGYEVTAAYDGCEALDQALAQPFDIILLDVMMPKKGGFDVCREIRKNSQVAIIMVTARAEDFERIMGLDIGADDYIVKPFSPGEVMARVRAVLRRAHKENEKSRLTIGSLTIDLGEYQTQIDDTKIMLTKKETELLWALAASKNKVLTREHLLNTLWGYEFYGDTRTVDSHIKRLRAKLDVLPHPDWVIKTVWGVGYKVETAT